MQRCHLRALLAALALAWPPLCESFQTSRATPESFDCKAGVRNWKVGWSLEKKRWCCERHNLGCHALSESEPFNCRVGLDTAARSWSLDKKRFCCKTHNLGCNFADQATAVASNASSGSSPPSVERYGPGHCVSTWKTKSSHCAVRTDCADQDISRYPIALLCVDSAGGVVRHNFGEGSFAPVETFDTLIVCEECKADIGAQGQVSNNRALNATLQAFVMEVNEIKTKVLTTRMEVHSLSSVVHKVYPGSYQEQGMGDLFDCDAGSSNWMRGWSKEKKCWCCNAKNVACDSTNTACVPEVPVYVVPPVTSQMPAQTAFDCAAGADNHERGWSDAKKCWCCTSQGIGCDPLIVCPIEAPTVQPVRVVPMQPVPVVPVEPVVPVASPPLPPPEPQTTPPSALPEPLFDCRAGLDSYELGWSKEKKLWCCTRAGLGCVTKRAYRPQDPDEHFDCATGWDNADRGWSEDKKQWCCRWQDIGCDLDPYDCKQNFKQRATAWTPAKSYWCCQKRGVGCTPDSDRYDCFTGLHDTKRLWSRQKRHWCCVTNHIGCSRSVVQVVVRRPRVRRSRHSTTAVGARLAEAPPGHSEEVATSHVAITSAVRSLRTRNAGKSARHHGTRTQAPKKRAALATQQQQTWTLEAESASHARRLEQLRSRYRRATSREASAAAPFRARALADAEQAQQAQQVGQLNLWSGNGLTSDEAAAAEAAKRQLEASSAAEGFDVAARKLRQSIGSLGGSILEADLERQALPEEPVKPADDAADASSAAALVESFTQGAESATASMDAGDAIDRPQTLSPPADGAASGPSEQAEVSGAGWFDNDVEARDNVPARLAEEDSSVSAVDL